ncbi:MAG: hypothetical protein CMJ33_01450 [Phycisphaerae bacterium]|nr:hypothetical protein [Phycisphaerae bacterium]HAW95943.1 hypothetical protein [Phycisphaerales bacterium]
MAKMLPRMILIGIDLEKGTRDRLAEDFEITEVNRSDEAIELLLNSEFDAGVFEPGKVPDSDLARNLQVKINDVDDAGGKLLDLDAERVSPLNLAERLHLLESRVADGLLNLFGWRHFEVRLLDRETAKLELVIANGITPLPIGHVIHARIDGNGISGHVAAVGKSYICRDSLKDERWVDGMEGGRSSLTIPLRLHERTIGVLNVESAQPDRFNDEDRLLLELYGRYVAMTVNILDMLIVERYTTNKRLSNNVLTELESPINEIEEEASTLLELASDDPAVQEHLGRITESLAAMKARIQSCTAGPQTILGAEEVLHQEELEPILSGRTVMVVDDEPVVRQTISAVLEKRGCSVVVCKDGSAAINRIQSAASRSECFDLVISDVRMPDRNGYEVFKAAKDADEKTPVILMTGFGYDPHHSIVRSSQEGLHCFLFKPFQIEQLLEEVYKALVIEADMS